MNIKHITSHFLRKCCGCFGSRRLMFRPHASTARGCCFRLAALLFAGWLPVVAFAYDVSFYETEPNDLQSQADELPFRWTIKKGNIKSQDDVDWYRLDVDGPSSLRLELVYPADSYVYNLFLVSVLDRDQNVLSQTAAYAPDGKVSVDVGLGDAGAYLIVVETACEAYSGRCEYHRSDEYQLTVTVFDADAYIRETEPNNTISSADHYGNGGIMTGQIGSANDQDLFMINLSAPSDVIVLFSHPPDNYQYNSHFVQILNPNGEVVNATDIYAPDAVTEFGFASSEPGSYYIKVTGCASGARCDIHRTDQYMITTLISPVGGRSSNQLVGALDIDGNGDTDALTDGLLILRYMFGFGGSTLTDGAIGGGAVRGSTADVAAYLRQFFP